MVDASSYEWDSLCDGQYDKCHHVIVTNDVITSTWNDSTVPSRCNCCCTTESLESDFNEIDNCSTSGKKKCQRCHNMNSGTSLSSNSLESLLEKCLLRNSPGLTNSDTKLHPLSDYELDLPVLTKQKFDSFYCISGECFTLSQVPQTERSSTFDSNPSYGTPSEHSNISDGSYGSAHESLFTNLRCRKMFHNPHPIGTFEFEFNRFMEKEKEKFVQSENGYVKNLVRIFEEGCVLFRSLNEVDTTSNTISEHKENSGDEYNEDSLGLKNEKQKLIEKWLENQKWNSDVEL